MTNPDQIRLFYIYSSYIRLVRYSIHRWVHLLQARVDKLGNTNQVIFLHEGLKEERVSYNTSRPLGYEHHLRCLLALHSHSSSEGRSNQAIPSSLKGSIGRLNPFVGLAGLQRAVDAFAGALVAAK